MSRRLFGRLDSFVGAMPFIFCATQLNRLCLFLRLWLCNSSRVGADTAVFIHSGFLGSLCLCFFFALVVFASIFFLRTGEAHARVMRISARLFAQIFQQCRYMPLSLLSALWRRFAALRLVCANDHANQRAYRPRMKTKPRLLRVWLSNLFGSLSLLFCVFRMEVCVYFIFHFSTLFS